MDGENTFTFVLGTLALVIGIALRLWISKRKFYRRNPAGMEEFKNFRTSIFTTILELVFNILGFILIVGGILILLLGLYATMQSK